VDVCKFKAVTAGNDFAIGLREDGTLVGWGNSAYGQINVPAGVYSAIAAGPISTAGVAMAATSVPLPSAGLAGMALLTALGVVRQVRPWKS
jgi:hypothetical protein